MKRVSAEEIGNIVEKIVRDARPKSVYAYGSWIGAWSEKDSDIRMLLVSRDSKTDFALLKTLAEKYTPLNLTILTEDEIKNGAHPSFNSFCYIDLLFSSILLYGRDVLAKEFSKFPDVDSALWRVQCILQRIRNVLSNKNKSDEALNFEKLNRWLRLVVSEFLFLTKGYFDPNPSGAKKKFEESFFKLDASTLEDFYDIFCRIKKMYLARRHQRVKIRPGVFVLFRNDSGKYLVLERSDGQGFEFVKGGVNAGEDFIDAAAREVREEIGLRVTPGEIIQLPVVLSFRFPLKEGYEIRIYKGFLITKNLDPGALRFERFFRKARFMGLDEISRVISAPEYYRIVKEADSLLHEKFGLILGLNRIKLMLQGKRA